MPDKIRSVDKQRLGVLMRNRRMRLGRNQDELQSFGGPSVETVRKFEQGEFGVRPQNTTFAAIERALLWAPGSCRDILNGGEPVELAYSAVAAAGRAQHGSDNAEGGGGFKAVESLIQIANAAMNVLEENQMRPEMKTAVITMKACISAMEELMQTLKSEQDRQTAGGKSPKVLTDGSAEAS